MKRERPAPAGLSPIYLHHRRWMPAALEDASGGRGQAPAGELRRSRSTPARRSWCVLMLRRLRPPCRGSVWRPCDFDQRAPALLYFLFLAAEQGGVLSGAWPAGLSLGATASRALGDGVDPLGGEAGNDAELLDEAWAFLYALLHKAPPASLPAPLPAYVTGVAYDGYYVFCTVYADVNGNRLLDANEPSAVTDVFGKYSIATQVRAGRLFFCVLVGFTSLNWLPCTTRPRPCVRVCRKVRVFPLCPFSTSFFFS